MNKKLILIIGIVLLIILIIAIFKLNSENKSINDKQEDSSVTKSDVHFDESTGLYYIINEENGEIRAASKDVAELQIYIDQPDLIIDPLEHHNSLEDFIFDEDKDVGVNE